MDDGQEGVPRLLHTEHRQADALGVVHAFEQQVDGGIAAVYRLVVGGSAPPAVREPNQRAAAVGHQRVPVLSAFPGAEVGEEADGGQAGGAVFLDFRIHDGRLDIIVREGDFHRDAEGGDGLGEIVDDAHAVGNLPDFESVRLYAALLAVHRHFIQGGVHKGDDELRLQLPQHLLGELQPFQLRGIGVPDRVLPRVPHRQVGGAQVDAQPKKAGSRHLGEVLRKRDDGGAGRRSAVCGRRIGRSGHARAEQNGDGRQKGADFFHETSHSFRLRYR